MKLKTIASIFKRNKRLIIYNTDDGEQWICNGHVAYSMRGMPKLTAGIILKIFDVPPDKYSDWLCNDTKIPEGIDISDYLEEESDIEHEKIIIDYYGDNYLLFPDKTKIYAINEEYIKPLLDEPEYLTFHKRVTKEGGFYLAAKVGLELKAVIAPMLLHKDEKYIESILRIGNLYRSMKHEEIIDTVNEFSGIKNTEQSEAPEQPEQGKLLN